VRAQAYDNVCDVTAVCGSERFALSGWSTQSYALKPPATTTSHSGVSPLLRVVFHTVCARHLGPAPAFGCLSSPRSSDALDLCLFSLSLIVTFLFWDCFIADFERPIIFPHCREWPQDQLEGLGRHGSWPRARQYYSTWINQSRCWKNRLLCARDTMLQKQDLFVRDTVRVYIYIPVCVCVQICNIYVYVYLYTCMYI